MRRTPKLIVAGIMVAMIATCCFFVQRNVSAQSANVYQVLLYPTYQFETLKYPTGLGMFPNNPTLYIADTGSNVIRSFYNGTLTTIAGNGTAGYVNGAALSAEFNHPTGLGDFQVHYWLNSSGQSEHWIGFLVNDSRNFVTRTYCSGMMPPGVPCATVNTAYGNNVKGYVNGTATTSEFATMGQVKFNGTNVYLADAENDAIRVTASTGLTTFAGT